MKKKEQSEVSEAKVTTKSERMMLCLKAMNKNEKLIARLNKRIQSVKSLNDELAEKFKSIINEK